MRRRRAGTVPRVTLALWAVVGAVAVLLAVRLLT
jgi:hypothetical protein